MRDRLLWPCLLLLCACIGTPTIAWGAGGRQEAAVFLDPSFEKVGGDSTTAVLTVQYDESGVGIGLRGYHLAISFDESYVLVNDLDADIAEGSFLPDVDSTAFFTYWEDATTFVVDSSILGATAGAFGAGDLCSITFTGQAVGDGVSPIAFVEVELRDPDNMSIPRVTTDASIELDNTPPDVPFMVGEPPYTAGTTNTVYWSDQSASGAVGYCAEAAENPDFDPIYMSSGCTPLLQATFGPLTDGQIYYYRVKCRDDVWNVSDWSITRFSTQDDTPPESEAGPLDPYYNTYAITIPVSGSDATSGISSIRLFYQVDGGGYQQYNGTFPVAPILFQAVVEGDYDFYTIARDVVGNVEAPPSSPDCSTVIDITDPPPIVDFEALPGHNKIHLSWSTPVGRDAPIEGTVIVRKPWGLMAYPEYDDVSPPLGYPAHPTDGTVVAFVPGTGAQTYDDESFDDSSRNVYYYTAFARDAAGNHSAAAASAQDRSTSYWLGDVDDPTGTPGVYDGYVDFYDKLILSDSYYTQDGDTYYEPEMDVGPTDDESRFGIPLTDNWIDFEDLMIVAMNYGRVDPSGKLGVPALPADVSAGPLRVALTLDGGTFAVGEEIDVGVVLSGGSRPKGVSCLIGYDPSRLEFLDVAARGALADLGGQAFVYGQEIASGRFLLDFAALGVDRVIEADGAVASLSFRVLSGEPTDVRFVELTVRGPANEKIECEREDLSLGGDGAASWAYRLEQNTPNPFNPCTTVGFAIPRSEHVTLAVYAPSGRLVRTLIDGLCEAGRRSVTWDGTSSDGAEAASGVYLCVLEARGARLTRKMVLMK